VADDELRDASDFVVVQSHQQRARAQEVLRAASYAVDCAADRNAELIVIVDAAAQKAAKAIADSRALLAELQKRRIGFVAEASEQLP
jgi:hypothetical protein